MSLRNVALFLCIFFMLFLFIVGIDIFTPIDIPGISLPIPVSTQQANLPTATSSSPTGVSGNVSESFGETAESALKTILNRGKITVAASVESGPHSYRESGAFKGYEVDLAREIVRRWFKLGSTDNPEDKGFLSFVGVSVIDRENELRNNKNIDFLVGGVSFTEKRCVGDGLICTSKAHFSDLHALLVNKNSIIKDYCDPALDSAQTYITVLSNTAAVNTIKDYKSECGFKNDIKLDTKPSRKDAFDEVKNSTNRLKVYKTERRFLEFYVKYFGYSDNLKVIVDEKNLKSETYVMWLVEGNSGLRGLLDKTMAEMRNDGKFKQICQKYFGQSEASCDTQ